MFIIPLIEIETYFEKKMLKPRFTGAKNCYNFQQKLVQVEFSLKISLE